MDFISMKERHAPGMIRIPLRMPERIIIRITVPILPHAGDMPVLEGNRGRAWTAFYTERFTPEQVKGKTVIIHSMADDYRSQPSGDSGEKVACGTIR